MDILPSVVQDQISQLPLWLQSHIERSREVALKLANLHNIDETPVDLAISAHDLAKAMDGSDILIEATNNGIVPNFVEMERPELLHGAVAAIWLKKKAGVDDERVLEAGRWHTTGKKCMGMVAKIVFLADKLDPDKIKKSPWLGDIELLANDNVALAIRRYLEGRLRYLLNEGELIHPESVEFRNSLML